MNRNAQPGNFRTRKPVKDFTGVRVGKLVVTGMVELDPVQFKHKLAFECDCGNKLETRLHTLKVNKKTDCGKCKPLPPKN
jgi:hypothetical protein